MMLFWTVVAQAANWLEQLVLQFGYLGFFLIAFIGAVSIFIPVPYTVVIFTLGGSFDPTLIALTAGLGSTLGEFSSYIVGAYGAKMISEPRRRKMEFMVKVFNKWGPLAVFVFALTPLPDDLLFIPLGMMRYNIPKAFVSAFCGKVLMNFIVAYSGRFTRGFIYDVIRSIFGEPSDLLVTLVTAAIAIALLIIAVVIMLRLDWEKIYYRHVKKKELVEKKDENNR
ncbi:MAG TPA: VTT domain-containing protein [Candidatus Krumholzibacteriaceae bacterium]|nr:VTT domain-containing protein [Candidatus Krumholzibacteriaceae bacterium]